MSPAHPTAVLTVLLLAPLLAWRVRARWRRLTARQRISPLRTAIHLSLFTTLLALLAWLWRAQPPALLHLAAGAVAGVVLAWLSRRRTRFEPTRQGIFYQPDRWLGGGLFLLTVGQLGDRLLDALWLHPGLPWAQASARGLTPACLGLWLAHQLAYALALAHYRHRLLAARRARQTDPPR